MAKLLFYFGGGGGALRTADGVDGTPFAAGLPPGGAAGARLMGCPLPLSDTRAKLLVAPSTKPCKQHRAAETEELAVSHATLLPN